MKKSKHREVKCLSQDHTDSGEEVPESSPLSILLCSPTKGMEGGPANQGHRRERWHSKGTHSQEKRVPGVAETGVAWKSSPGIVACVLSVAGASGLLCMWQGYCTLLPQLPRPYPAKVAVPTAAWTACRDLDMLRACGWLRLALPEHLLWLQCSSCSLQSGSAGGESPFAKMTQQKM